jgi:hypothetical protein
MSVVGVAGLQGFRSGPPVTAGWIVPARQWVVCGWWPLGFIVIAIDPAWPSLATDGSNRHQTVRRRRSGPAYAAAAKATRRSLTSVTPSSKPVEQPALR